MKTINNAFQVLLIAFLVGNYSVNAQSTWQKLANLNDANAGVWMSSNASKNYVITSDRWIYHNNNSTDEWIPFVDVPSFYTVGSIKASKVSNRVFCLTSTNGIAFTDDMGATWQSNNLNGGGGQTGLGAYVLAYALNGTTVIASTLGPVSGGIQNPLFVSNNNGVSFSSLPTLDFYPTGLHYLDNNQIYSNTPDGIFKTSNISAAGSWSQIGFAGLEVTDLSIDGSILYASVNDNTIGKVFKSIDDGQNWIELTGLATNATVSKLAFDSANQRLYATTTAGVFVYENNSWSMVSANNKAHDICITANQSALFCGVRVNGIQRVNAVDLTVTPLNNGLVINSDFMVVSSDNQLYTASMNTSFLSKLNLNNVTWSSQVLREDLDFTRNVSMGVASDGQCVIGGMHFIAKTANEGNSIATIADEATAPLAPIYTILFPQQMFLGNNNSISMIQHASQDYIDYSPDMGATWSVLYQNVSGQFPAFLNFTKVCSGLQDHYILGLSMQTAQSIIAHSDDQGATWVELPNPPQMVRNLFMDRFDQLYAVTTSTIYSWNTSTEIWTPLNIDLGSTSSNKVVEVKFDFNNKMYVLVRSTTTPFSEEGFYISNFDETAFTHVPFEVQGGQSIAFKNLSFSLNNIPVAMTDLENRDFNLEGIYYFSEGSFLNSTSIVNNTITVYPNPATNKVFITELKNKNTLARLTSISGNSFPVQIISGSFDVTSIANGFYMLNINDEGKAMTVKLVVNH